RAIVDDEIGRPVGERPMAPVELLERIVGPGLGGPDPAPLLAAIRASRARKRATPCDWYRDALGAPVGGQFDLLPGAGCDQHRPKCRGLGGKGPGSGHQWNTSCMEREVPKRAEGAPRRSPEPTGG